MEDEEINRTILASALEDFDVLYAADGVEAIELAKAHKNDLAVMLLDLMMPIMGGMEVLRDMKADPELKHIPILVLTADHNAEVDCLSAGAMDFIPKPYPNLEIIRTRVNKCIELSEHRQMIQSTERDSLTKLYNIDYFFRYVDMYDQHYADMSMDAIVMDVDRFHLINERCGKQYGDALLGRIGERVRVLAREVGGVGCRSGVDTFLLYRPHREDYARMLEKVSAGLVEEGEPAGQVRLRMGVYARADKTLEVFRRFENAKTAADSVRGSGARSVGVYDEEMQRAEQFRSRLLEDFRSSLEQGLFRVHFQPKYDVRGPVPVLAGAEALVRWEHPALGVLAPEEFIPLLEENGFILALDKYVWRETAGRLRDWKARCGAVPNVSVNVSRVDMLTPDIRGIFDGLLEEFGLTAAELTLELAEPAFSGEAAPVIAAAQTLRDMGFAIEMDDFGTGSTGLGALTGLPVDALKMDVGIVRAAFDGAGDLRSVQLILDIARRLGVPAAAEGVETAEQYQALRDLGCALMQGDYFSKPVPPEAFAERFLTDLGGTK